MDCVFCKIAKGEIDSAKVAEDEKILAFLDVNPLTRGHCLIIPKEHFENIFDINPDVLKEIIVSAKKLADQIKNNLGVKGVNLVNASGKFAEQSVFHFHLHIVPRYEGDGLNMNDWWQTKAQKADFEELKNLALQISPN
ncbi:MAG: HIT family protein [Candidatus Staskawiczbacteria bacterium]|nr:HIT family protein [Candidatus Staskawiczbacteria bacterium]